MTAAPILVQVFMQDIINGLQIWLLFCESYFVISYSIYVSPIILFRRYHNHYISSCYNSFVKYIFMEMGWHFQRGKIFECVVAHLLTDDDI